MSYTSALIFATLLHNQQTNIDLNSKEAFVKRNEVNTNIINTLEKKGLAESLVDGRVLINPKEIELNYGNPGIIDSDILESLMVGPSTTSW